MFKLGQGREPALMVEVAQKGRVKGGGGVLFWVVREQGGAEPLRDCAGGPSSVACSPWQRGPPPPTTGPEKPMGVIGLSPLLTPHSPIAVHGAGI